LIQVCSVGINESGVNIYFRRDEVVRSSDSACIIETGSIDFVDDPANIVPAVLTLAMMGLPPADWEIYREPTHALVYTPSDSPARARVAELMMELVGRLYGEVAQIRRQPWPWLAGDARGIAVGVRRAAPS
jgi:hypothetical protein